MRYVISIITRSGKSTVSRVEISSPFAVRLKTLERTVGGGVIHACVWYAVEGRRSELVRKRGRLGVKIQVVRVSRRDERRKEANVTQEKDWWHIVPSPGSLNLFLCLPLSCFCTRLQL